MALTGRPVGSGVGPGQWCGFAGVLVEEAGQVAPPPIGQVVVGGGVAGVFVGEPDGHRQVLGVAVWVFGTQLLEPGLDGRGEPLLVLRSVGVLELSEQFLDLLELLQLVQGQPVA